MARTQAADYEQRREAIVARAGALVRQGCFPIDNTGRRYPWPMV